MKEKYFSPFPVLQTERCLLRQIKESDKNEIFFLRSDAEINRYLDRPIAENLDDAVNFIIKVNGLIKDNEAIDWGISFKNEQKIIGTICLWKISFEKKKAEIGFELLPEAHGKGIMQEIIPVVLKFGFNNLGLLTIEGEADPANIKSIKLMEKFGFTLKSKSNNTAIFSLNYHTYKS